MNHAIFHPTRGAYVEHARNPTTGKVVPFFTWRRARKPQSDGGPMPFESPGAAKRYLEEKLKTPDHGMERCFVAPLE